MISEIFLAVVTAGSPIPPSTFEINKAIEPRSGLWSEAGKKHVTNPWSDVSSSSPNGEATGISDLGPVTITASTPSKLEGSPKKLLLSDEAVNVQDAQANVFEIRQLFGLSWSEIAELLNVDRRTVHNWAKGGSIRPKNKERIAAVLDVVRFVDDGSSEENRTKLGAVLLNGSTVSASLKGEQYKDVTTGLGKGRSRLTRIVASNIELPQLGAMRLHKEAIGDEISGELAFEPKPKSRKRTVRRS